MRKIFLISPSLQEKVQIKLVDNSYSMGLAYLHSVLEQAGYVIKTKNYNNINEQISKDDICSELSDFAPDYLLIQMFTMNRVAGYRIIELAKKTNKNIKIIVGGIHATIMYDQLLKNFDIDYIVLGEGEETIIELLNALDVKKDISSIKGIAYRVNGNVVKNNDRELIENLDRLPFPKHELFITPKRKMACILTSRGCPFKCSFCCLHTISKRIYRKRSVKNVVDEIEYIINKFKNIKVIQLADDTFTLDQERVINICKEIISRKISIEFLCSARIKPASTKMFEFMEKAGFTAVGFGLETGSRKLLKSIHKNITPEDVLETFEMLKDVNIKVVTFMMVGFPGESLETINETLSLTKKLQKIKYYEIPGTAPLLVYPNTEVFEIMKENGAIDETYWLSNKDVPYFTLENSFEMLKIMGLIITLSSLSIKGKILFLFEQAFKLLMNPTLIIQKLQKLKLFFNSCTPIKKVSIWRELL